MNEDDFEGETLEDDEFLAKTGVDEERKKRKGQVSVTIRPDMIGDLDKIVEDEGWNTRSRLMGELARRYVIEWRNRSATKVLAHLLKSGKISVEDLVSIIH